MGVHKSFSMAGAKVGNKGGNYFSAKEASDYVCEIIAPKMIDRRGKAPMFVLEMKVRECENTDLVGKSRSWTCPLDTDWAPGNMLEMTAAVLGIDPHDAGAVEARLGGDKADKELEKGLDGAWAGKQVFVGCVSRLIKNGDKNDPKDYRDICSFLPVPE